MTAPSREDLDRAIDETAETVTSLLLGRVAPLDVKDSADLAHKLASAGLFLLDYRNNLDMDAREAKWAAEEAQSKIGGGK